MAFCIQCGAPNDADSTFCVACGQTLYHEPKNRTSRYGKRKKTWIVIAGVLLLLAMTTGVWLIVESGKRVENTELTKVPPSSGILDAPVLTILALNRKGDAVSQGSGFVLTADGLAGTNYHVLKGAAGVFAECCKGRMFEIHSIEGADLEKDLVVFQLYERGTSVKPHDLTPVILGSSKDLKVGEKLIAIGSPQGLENTVSDGILSAIREYNSVRYLQITAPISPGSSGGPVLTQTGTMVGVATFQFEKGQNLNFAIDADHLRPLLEQHFGLSLAQFQSAVRSVRAEKSANDDSPVVRNKIGTNRPLTGEFGGTVHNESVNLSAGFGIIVRDDEGILNGCMIVENPLFGSGPLTGNVEATGGVYFLVKSAVGDLTFTGARKGGSVIGTYVFTPQEGADQQGTFTLQKANSKSLERDFDTNNCPTDAEIHK